MRFTFSGVLRGLACGRGKREAPALRSALGAPFRLASGTPAALWENTLRRGARARGKAAPTIGSSTDFGNLIDSHSSKKRLLFSGGRYVRICRCQ